MIANVNKTRLIPSVVTLCLSLLTWTLPLKAESVPKELLGEWSLNLESGLPAWMRIGEEDGKPLVYMRIYIGPTGPYKEVKLAGGRLQFEMKKKRKQGTASIANVDVGMKDGKLDGVIQRQLADGALEHDPFTGKKVPPIPATTPNLSKVHFGHPITLFNGKDLSGWRPHESDKINGWGVVNGILVNTTTKTDFSPTGAYANLRTEAEFADFWLHVEFLVEEKRNSGIYLRGMYEAQVVDRDSRMQGLQGVGAIFGRIAPSANAGKPGGAWQTYDLTLVDRHITVVLNGVKVIDNKPILGPTAGAIYTDASSPGPIYLQGDHTTVKYKDLYLAPVVRVR